MATSIHLLTEMEDSRNEAVGLFSKHAELFRLSTGCDV